MENLQQIFSVTEISRMLRDTVERSFSNVKIRGELSGITRATSGHIYLSIKDTDSVINAIIWRATTVNFDLAEGTEIIATGKLTTYPARSNYQLIISEIEMAGMGSILKMLEERKQKLAAEGLFDSAHKKPLPEFPSRIGIVTSPTGAAFQDIQNKLRDRLPVKVILYPAQVQGATAAREVVAGIKYFNDKKNVDVIIVARGGGSLEDLLPFSEEIVVRAAAASEIPIISGVGHEPDWMLIDFAADVRAPTPTGAAEIVVPTKQTLLLNIDRLAKLLITGLLNRLRNAEMRLDGISIKNPQQMLDGHRERIADLSHNMMLHFKNKITIEFTKLSHMTQMLDSLSYKNVLRRGYAIVRVNNKIISSKDDFSVPATIEFSDGIKNI